MEHHSLQLYNYHVWANTKVFERLKELPTEIFKQEVKSVFSSLSAVISHIYLTDVVWLSTMSGNSFDETRALVGKLSSEWKTKSMDDMEKGYLELTEKYHQFLHSHDLDSSITIAHPAYGSNESSYSDLIQHVVNHGTYHRGNITAMLRQLGYPGPSTDYVYFLYELSIKK